MAIRVLTRSTISILKPYNFSTISKTTAPIPTSLNSIQEINKTEPAKTIPKLETLRDFDTRELEKPSGIHYKLKISPNVIASMINNCPSTFDIGFLKKWELGFKNLGVFCVSPLMIQSVLEHSSRFGIVSYAFTKCVKVLKGLGFSDGTVIRIFEEFARVVMIDEDYIRAKVEFLRGIGIGAVGVNQVCCSCPWILGFSLEHRLKPMLDEFVKLGFNENVIRREVLRDSRILTMELGELSRCLEFLRTLKCRVPIMESIYSHGLFRAGFDVKLRVDCLCKHGLTRKDAFSILWREPRLITYEVMDIEKKVDFLLHNIKCEIEWLVKVPEYLGVNFDKQIVPRYNVIEYLRSQGGLFDKVELSDLIKPSRLKFYNFYVKPYPECEEIFGRFSREFEERKRHPAGLWKMFKPQKYPVSKKDAENVKSFMKELR